MPPWVMGWASSGPFQQAPALKGSPHSGPRGVETGLEQRLAGPGGECAILRAGVLLVGGHRGITLVELMVVVAIIAIIAATAIAYYQGIQQKARLATHTSTAAALRSAVAIYYSRHNGNFPPSKAVLNTPVFPSPPVFQYVGQAYSYDANNGLLSLTVNDATAC